MILLPIGAVSELERSIRAMQDEFRLKEKEIRAWYRRNLQEIVRCFDVITEREAAKVCRRESGSCEALAMAMVVFL